MVNNRKITDKIGMLEIEAKIILNDMKKCIDEMQRENCLSIEVDSLFMKKIDKLKDIKSRICYCKELDKDFIYEEY